MKGEMSSQKIDILSAGPECVIEITQSTHFEARWANSKVLTCLPRVISTIRAAFDHLTVSPAGPGYIIEITQGTRFEARANGGLIWVC
ncbi:hypothetical protein Y032_0326g2579 [Ancylostoma ceylanicum]|uniref:Uncharacterized protein n=1 Tax=Ancylostoma ceylanicum TaxID=53326 RepID=A0A016S029_9BILA|nr:hypothetical protein Y032_0326g2579 [Ancylostoma ceylanicum]